MTTLQTQPPSGSQALLYTQQRYFFVALDPIHVGAGGYRLGRVDMTIVREPGTQLPKIPGTSLSGAARSYAAMRYGKRDAAGQHNQLKKDLKEQLKKGVKVKCPILYTFGTATDSDGNSGTASEGSTQAGTVSIGDAHILFFPVNSRVGPIWVSTPEIVEEAWGAGSVTLPQQNGQEIIPDDDTIVTSLPGQNTSLNLGWLLFDSKSGLQLHLPPGQIASCIEWTAIASRLALVSTKLFSQIVNSNLEVRTSVSISPQTGAAEAGALFTYEAVPRTTWLWSDVVEDDYRKTDVERYPFPITSQYDSKTNMDNAGTAFPVDKQWKRPLDVVSAGMQLIEYLGVGGMGTRGFGRMKLVDEWEISNGGIQ